MTMPANREYLGQDLCLDYGEHGHLRIPEEQHPIALISSESCQSGRRILELSPFTRLPIVICDESKITSS